MLRIPRRAPRGRAVFDQRRNAARHLATGTVKSGSGDQWTLKENTRSFNDRQILPRMLAGVTTPDLSTTLLGSKVGTPIFIPPMAAHGLAHVSAEKGTARGAAASKALFCTQTLANTTLEEIAKELHGKVKIVKLNIDENHRTPSRYNVRAIPTLMIFKDGQLAATQTGALPKGRLADWISGTIGVAAA